MSTSEFAKFFEIQRKIEEALKEAEGKIKLDKEFLEAFKGRFKVELKPETRPEKDWKKKFISEGTKEDEELRASLEKMEIEAGGFEKRFGFSGYVVHIYSSRGIAGAGIFINEELVGAILIDSSRRIASAKAEKRLLSDPAGNALFTHLIKLFSENIKDVQKMEGGGHIIFERPLKTARAMAVFSSLFASKKIQNYKELKEHVISLAHQLEISAVSCCFYLRTVLAKGEKKGLGRLEVELTAETKNTLQRWEQTKDVSDLKERIFKAATLMEVDPITFCGYLLTLIPRSEKKEIEKIKMELVAKKKNIVERWNRTNEIDDLLRRVLLTADFAEVSPFTCCEYLIRALPRAERPGIVSLRQKLASDKRFHKCGILGRYDTKREIWHCPNCDMDY